MGYKYSPGAYRMEFDDGPLTGLVITLRQAGGDALHAIEQLPPVVDDRLEPLWPCLTVLAESIIGWNMTESGSPVPASAREFLRRDKGFLFAVLGRWVTDVRSALARAVEQSQPVPVEPGFDPSDIPVTILSSVPSEPPEPASAAAKPAPRKRAPRKRPTVVADSAEAI